MIVKLYSIQTKMSTFFYAFPQKSTDFPREIGAFFQFIFEMRNRIHAISARIRDACGANRPSATP